MDLIQIRRQLINQQYGMPSIYQQVQYLQSNGGQWIDTGVSLKDEKNYWIYEKFAINSDASSNNCILGRAGGSGYYLNLKYPNWYNNNIEIRGYNISDNYVTTLEKNIIAEMIFDYSDGNQKCYFNGALVKTGTNAWSAGPADSLLMFASTNSSGTATWKAKAKIYDIQIKCSGAMIRKFVPCYRKGDNKPGMYDMVEKKFYTNEGQNDFTVGPIVIQNPTLPSQYKKVNYIKPQSNAYINTGYAPQIGDEIRTTFARDSTAQYGVIFSAGTGSYQLIGQTVFSSSTNTYRIYFKYFSSASAVAAAVNLNPDGTWYDLTINNVGILTVNKTSVQSTAENEIDGDNNTLYLFRRRNLETPFIGKIKRFKIINSNQIIHDYIPCIRVSDSVAGFYDTVSQTFLTNAHTSGSFIAG